MNPPGDVFCKLSRDLLRSDFAPPPLFFWRVGHIYLSQCNRLVPLLAEAGDAPLSGSTSPLSDAQQAAGKEHVIIGVTLVHVQLAPAPLSRPKAHNALPLPPPRARVE